MFANLVLQWTVIFLNAGSVRMGKNDVRKIVCRIFALLLLMVAHAHGQYHYVNVSNATPVHPYTSWETAATNIQAAIDASVDGDTILVTNGVYVLPREISINRSVRVESVNGYTSTVISGNDNYRCFSLSHSNALVRGFTLTHGLASEGGAVSLSSGVVQDCLLKENKGRYKGGGAFLSGSGILRNCIVVGNRVYDGWNGTVWGGGIYMSQGGVVENCTVVGNEANAGWYGDAGGGIYCYGVGMSVRNSVFYRNTARYGADLYSGPATYLPAGTVLNCLVGTDPLFVDMDAGDYRFGVVSPCVDAGLNAEWMTVGVDFGGNPRVLGQSVDIGAYEYVPAPRQLIINCSPVLYGTAEPLGYGNHTVMELTTVTNRIANPVIETGGVHYVCSGWTGTGSAPSSGNTAVVVFTLKQDSSLTWQWALGHWLELQASNGVITGSSSGWKPEGATCELLPWGAAGYAFDHWLVNSIESGGAVPLKVVIGEPLLIEAVFKPIPPIETAWVGIDPTNNIDDTTGFGAVPYNYFIGKNEVVCREYAAFLNSVARNDTYGLYNSAMGRYGGITRSGIVGGYSYQINAGWENKPVTYVSYFDALRYANWLSNGQPDGEQDATTTEDGAYTFTGPQSVGDRKPGWTYALASEDEWYKAAYYDPMNSRYFKYATMSDTLPAKVPPPGGTNAANYEWAVGSSLTEAGSYVGSPGPFGTCDQNGNVAEWTESYRSNGSKSVRGGSAFIYMNRQGYLLESGNSYYVLPGAETIAASSGIGFRVVRKACGLTVEGYPGRRGVPSPYSYGFHKLSAGMTASNSVPSILAAGDGVRYVCTGWTGTGDIPATGQTNSVVFTVTTNSLQTWQWETQYWLSLVASNGVIAGATPGWKPEGYVYDLQPTGHAGFMFDHWEVDGVPAGNTVPLSFTITNPCQVEAVFKPAFIDITESTQSGLVKWELNRQTGTYFATLEIYNPSNAVKRLTGPFWFVLQSTPQTRLMNPDGMEPKSGWPYVDITERVNQALVLADNHDRVLDPGERVRVAGVEVYSYDRSIPSGYVYAVWADPPDNISIDLFADTDGDGIPNDWESRFASLSQNNPADAEDDGDGDGMSNLAEYIADTNPTDKNSVLRILRVEPLSDGMRLKWAGGIEAEQILEYSRDLKVWNAWYTNMPPTSITNETDYTGYEKSLFFRVRVEGRQSTKER